MMLVCGRCATTEIAEMAAVWIGSLPSRDLWSYERDSDIYGNALQSP